MNIFTLTLNPAFDIHAEAKSFALHKESVASVTSRDVGGKGINISRALSAFGAENEAFVVLGSENGREFSAMLDADGVKHTAIVTEGRIRENITVHVQGERETRLSFRGFTAGDELLDRLEEQLLPRLSPDDVLTFTGSVPRGISRERITTFLMRVRARGAQLVLDSKDLTREDILSLRPALIKPNEEEVSAYVGKEALTLSDCVSGARELSLSGVFCAMVSFGGEGAILAASGHVYLARPPKIEPISTVGAGDSSIAGFLCASLQDASAEECLKMAVAFGTAACLTEGTNPPRKEDVEALLPLVTVESIL
ncbi:MAG: 1-phosphofructokinase family hexose kinase [Ruminococcaceae bacterium]|nr:1-phosphofructokinase family hexose kinase [Oscillospiraceae bacterium]